MDYTTVAEVKAFGGISGTATDAALALLITAASAFIDNYCDRDFAMHAGATEIRNGTGTQKLMPYFSPITAVTSVTVDGQAIPAAPSTIARGFVFDKEMIYLRDARFCRGFQNVVIVYSGGYATAPVDVKQACIELVLYKWAKRDRLDKKMETLQGQNVMFENKDMPEGVKTALNNYRRWMV